MVKKVGFLWHLHEKSSLIIFEPGILNNVMLFSSFWHLWTILQLFHQKMICSTITIKLLLTDTKSTYLLLLLLQMVHLVLQQLLFLIILNPLIKKAKRSENYKNIFVYYIHKKHVIFKIRINFKMENTQYLLLLIIWNRFI